MKLGYGGSLLKDFKLLRCRQKLRASSVLLMQNGAQLHSVGDKLDRCQEHFAKVSNVGVEAVENVLSSVLETAYISPPLSSTSDSLSSVLSENEIKAALMMMRNGWAPLQVQM